ncbi:MAG: type II toxin-antitoxin system VapC family toxin [Armatimonadota bacterium]
MATEPAFWDASAVVPLCVDQPAAGVLRRLVRQHSRLVVWWGTPVEVAGALTRLMRQGLMTAQGRGQAQARLAVLRRAWAEVLPTEALRDLAEGMPTQHDVRAADAFQLAAAVVWCRERPRNRPFICYDRRLAVAAERVGFTVIAR